MPITPPDELPIKHPAPTPPPKVDAGPREGGVWAVVVGVDDYPGERHDLKAAAADARAVDSALAAYGVPADHRRLLVNGEASGDTVLAALSWLAGRAGPDATAVVFFAGHARIVRGADDGDDEPGDEALVGADGGIVLDGRVAQILRPLAGHVWIGIATCYSAGFDDLLAPGRVLTAAAAEDDLAYEQLGFGHSFLVEYMVRRAMLERRAADSVQDSFRWADGALARDFPEHRPVMIERSAEPVRLGAVTNSAPVPEPAAPATSGAAPLTDSPAVAPAASTSPATPAGPAPPSPAPAECRWAWPFPVCSRQTSQSPPTPGGSPTTTGGSPTTTVTTTTTPEPAADSGAGDKNDSGTRWWQPPWRR